MPLGETIDGYLDCRNAILRVSKLEALGASGVDTPTNMVKGNSVMLFDDMGSDLANPPFSLGGASRDTSTPRITFTTGAGFAYTGIKLPNAWVGHFDLEFPNTNTGTKIKLHLYTESSSTYANDGYELEFNADGSVKLYYDGGGVLASGSVTFAATTWYDTAVMFDRGTFVVTVGNETIINFEDVERSRVYDNSSGQFLRFAATAANCRARAIKFINSVGGWIHNKEGVMSCVAGNVVVGAKTTDFKFDVRGTANVGALTATSASIPDVSVTGTSQTALQVTGGIDVGKNIVVASAGMVGVGISPEAKVHVHGGDVLVTEDDTSTIHARSFHSTANNRAVLNLQGSRGTKASPTVVQDGDVLATVQGQGYDGTAFQTAVKITGEVDGAAGNGDVPGRLTFHTTPDGSTTPAERLRIDASGQIGINTTSPGALLDVRGTANVGVLSATLPLATLASNLVTYDTATGQLMDSNGLVSNKLAIVSEQPPSALTGDSTVVDGHGRYKVTTSLEASGFEGYKVFDKTVANGWSTGAVGAYNNDGTYAGSNSLASVSGEWVKLELPYKTTLRHVALAPYSWYSAMPEDFSIVASNDDSTWVVLKSVDGQSWSSADDVNFVVNASTAYKYYAIVVELTNNNFAQIGEWKLFAESFSVNEGVVELPGALEKGFMEHPVVPIVFDEITGSYTSVGKLWNTTVDGHGAYEITASSFYTASGQQARPPWRLFNYQPTDGSYWQQGYGTIYNTSSPYEYTGTTGFTTDVGGTRYMGHWVQIKVPYAITLAHTDVYRTPASQFASAPSRAPGAGVFLGSNDGVAWYKLTEFSGASYASDDKERIAVNATTPYQYYRFVITNIVGGNSATVVNFNEWRLFAEKPVTRMENVHISGDLSSETLQTGYIKWPKVPLKANESEGYVATRSSRAYPNYEAWKAFNENANSSDDAWLGGLTNYITGGYPITTSGAPEMNGVYGDWLGIELPQSIKVSYIQLLNRNYSESARLPISGRFYGSKDNITFTELTAWSNISISPGYEPTRIDVNSNDTYKTYRIQVERISVASGGGSCAIGELQLFEAATGVGAAPTSAKLQVAGSLGMAKGSEFFAGDDVVMELPRHDRPLVKYPEIPITSSSTIDGYTATASSYVSREAWQAFDSSDTTSWTSNYGYSGSPLTGDEYLQLELPVAIKVVKMYIKAYASATYQHAPQDAELLGSNDGTTWVSLNTSTDLPLESYGASTWVRVNATQYYKYLRLKITKIYSGLTSYARVADLQFWGHEEGDTSVDVVHRSIPNKPGQQHLEVYWDANDSNSYSFADSTKVYDLSGNGATGTITGNNGFDSEYNAWVFDGNGDYVSTTLTTTTGAWVHSFSFWINADTTGAGHFVSLGTEGDDGVSAIRFSGANVFQWYFWGNDLRFNAPNTDGNWVHVVGTYDGGNDSGVSVGNLGVSRKIFINGKETTVSENISNTAGADPLNLTTTTTPFRIGTQLSGGAGFDGKIANVRIFSKKLSVDQIRELYDFEAARFGHREDLVSVHKGNLGIGLRDPEQRLVVKPQTDAGHFPQTEITHTGDFAYLHDNNSNARTFNVWTEKDGLLRVGCSTFFAGGDSNPLYPFQVFNTSGYRWQDSGAKYSTSNGSYTGSSSTTVDGTSRSGEYIEIVFGQPIQVEKFIMNVNLGGSFQNRGARTGVIAAKNYEDDSFTAVYELSGHAWNTNQDYEFFPSSSAPYRHYRFVIETLQGGTASDTASLTKWQFYGKYASTCNGAVLKTGGVVTGGVIAEAVSLGGKSSEAPLTVGKPAGGGAAMTSAASHWITNTGKNSTTQRVVTEAQSGISIYALGNILTRDYLISSSGTLQSSDRRIKTNIADVNDSSALEAFRLIKPKLYNYKDVVQQGTLPVWGFIAQEVGEVLNHSTQTRTEYIPNVYELANVFAEGTVLEFDTTKLQPGASELRLYDAGGAEQDVLIDEIIDEFTVRVSKPVDSRDRVFVFGQRVNDFTLLKKDAIWTTAAAALQQVDRELQAEKAKVKALERDARTTVRAVGAFEDVRDLIVNSSGARCALGEANAAFGIAASEGEGVCLARPGSETFLWVTDETGDRKLRVGDLVCLSDVGAGYAKRQEDDIVRASTVAKVLEACDFTQPHVSVKRVKTEEKDIVTYVKTLVVTREEYDALSENEREIKTVTYYGKDAWQRVAFNEYVDKWPHYDHSKYFRTVETSVDDDVYENLPENERANYSRGEDGVWTYVSTTYIETGVWETLGEDEKATYELGFFKIVVEESETAEEGYDARTRDVYKKIMGTSGASKDGFEQRTTRKEVPVLDAFGQMQYEETSETEVAYAVRHLDASGARATRHDAVNTAARIRVKVV